MELKVGDIVRLKTGGPKMTVNRVGPYGSPDDHDHLASNAEVQTAWFSDDEGCWNGPFADIFGMDALEKIEEAAPAQAEAA